MDTPVPPHYTLSWSHSSLKNYDTCPRKYYHEKVIKVIPYEENPAATWGLAVHTALEHHVKNNAPLPSNMEQYKDLATNVRTLSTEALVTRCEYQLATDINDAPVAYTAKEAHGRSILDLYLEMTPDIAVIVDYKTGKFRGSGTQPLVNAWMAFKHNLALDTVKTCFHYTQENYSDNSTFTRAKIESDFGVVYALRDRLALSVKHENFPAIKNGLCRNYCAVKTCVHNGRK